MTDQNELIALANSAMEHNFDGPKFGPATSTEKYRVVEVDTTYDGHDVRIVFTDSESTPADYRYNATVFESSTGKQIATGNGDTSWRNAFDIVHWGELRSFEWTD